MTAISERLQGAIPAMPLLLDTEGRVDWRAQRAVVRYHLAAGADGLAVGVHTTQFELHDDPVMLADLWQLVVEEVRASDRDPVLVAGVCGDAADAVREAGVARDLGFAVGGEVVGGGSDGNFTALIAPTLDGLGAPGDGAHATHEHVRLDRWPDHIRLLHRLMLDA